MGRFPSLSRPRSVFADLARCGERTMNRDRLIRRFDLEMQEAKCRPGENRWGAVAHLDVDLREVLPYLKALWKTKFFDYGRGALVCVAEGMRLSLEGSTLHVAEVENREDAERKVEAAVRLVNDAWARRGEIEPCYEAPRKPNLMDVFRRLPRTNCGKCGRPTCMAFAAAVREGEASAEECPDLI